MNINATLLAQAVVFIVFIAICWKYVYPPILAAMQEREKKISDGLNAAKKADDALEEARIAFEKELSNAKAEASEIIEKANNRRQGFHEGHVMFNEEDVLIMIIVAVPEELMEPILEGFSPFFAERSGVVFVTDIQVARLVKFKN